MIRSLTKKRESYEMCWTWKKERKCLIPLLRKYRGLKQGRRSYLEESGANMHVRRSCCMKSWKRRRERRRRMKNRDWSKNERYNWSRRKKNKKNRWRLNSWDTHVRCQFYQVLQIKWEESREKSYGFCLRRRLRKFRTLDFRRSEIKRNLYIKYECSEIAVLNDFFENSPLWPQYQEASFF